MKKQQDILTKGRIYNVSQKMIHEVFLNPTSTANSNYKDI